MKKPPIYISYAWGKPDSEEEKVVDALCERLTSNGYEYVRDKDSLQYLDSLREFLKTIGRGGYVIAIVGKRYLRSENCMIEASYMAQRGDLEGRVFPVLLSDLPEVFTIESRNKLIGELDGYWKDREQSLLETLRNLDYPQGFQTLRDDALLVTQMLNYLSMFVHFLGTVIEISPQTLLIEDFKSVFEKIEDRSAANYRFLAEQAGIHDNAEGFHFRFSAEYVGRQKNVDDILGFLNDPGRPFMLLYGVGGMGKSHLISECRKVYHSPLLRYAECTSNFDLRSLFKTCGIDYPEKLESSEEKIRFFLDEFTRQNLCLILDDFYETVNAEIRGMLPKLAGIPQGKILLVSRAIPRELQGSGVPFERYFIQQLKEEDFNTVIRNYVNTEQKAINLTPHDLGKIYEKAQGYPLGGQLIVDLLDLGEDLEDILRDLPKFEAELDEEGKKFSGRLLNNIFTKGNDKEIKLLCEFSASFGAASKELIKQLPSYDLAAFQALATRRKFIWTEGNGLFNSHAMIKDYAYDHLPDKPVIHDILGNYFEKKLFDAPDFETDFLEGAIQHYKRVGKTDLKEFGYRVNREFNIANVKSLIEDNVKDTIRNYENLLEIYPDKMSYYNELGIAYRISGDKPKAIETFLRAIRLNPNHLPLYNELGITYREIGDKPKAIEILLSAIEIDPTNLPIYTELGITYRENNQKQLAIETFLRKLEIQPNEVRVLNELGITYRENNQIQLAIETFLKRLEIEPNDTRSLNELGITYRENNQFEEAISICKKALRIDPNQKYAYVNLLQIYLFFQIDKVRALENFAVLNIPPRVVSFNNQRKLYKQLITKLDEIWDVSFDTIGAYERYVYLAIRYKAYHTIVPLLFRLNDKFPNNAKLLSRLSKTLSNQVIDRREEGYRFLKEALLLFKRDNDQAQYYAHVLYYLYNLLNSGREELLKTEIDLYKTELNGQPGFHRFLASYFESQNKSPKEIVECYKNAFATSKDKEETIKSVESMMAYLIRTEPRRYEATIEKLRNKRNALYKN